MIKTAICDDEANTRAYLASLICAQPCACEVIEYTTAEECLADRREIDVYLLDIELDGADGMHLARMLREREAERQPVIIFVTGYDRYVFDAFDVGAFQYLLKPVDEEKFAQVFARAVRKVQAGAAVPAVPAGRALTLQSGSVSRSIPLRSIYYVESSDHKVIFHLQDGQFVCYAKIRDLEQELQEQFFRIHKGYLVNLSYVAGYGRTEVTLANGEALLLSKYKYQDFVRAYLRFLKRGNGL